MKRTHTVYVIFNKETKLPVGYSLDSQITRGDVLYKEIVFDRPINLAYYIWDGDYETGSFVTRDETTAEVDEVELSNKMLNRVYRKYPPETILSLIVSQLVLMKKQGKLKEHNILPNVNEMLEFYEKSYKKMKEERDYYMDSKLHEYYDEGAMKDDQEKRFKV